jgi:tetraacyldisaccharide 4'-kinase
MDSWKIILFPFAWIYGWAVRFRHFLFNKGILKTESFPMPVISVGNISVGGTGKTPLIEYLTRLLHKDFKIATLSRGYGRKTKGFLIGNQFSYYKDIGDEPMQYLRKFTGKIEVAVAEKRTEGIRNLMENDPLLEVILLDDAFQHRYVKPGISILLTDFHKLYREDYLLPVGSLRDTINATKRADIIIVTKSYKVLSPITRKRITDILKPEDHQSLYFTYLKYGGYKALFDTYDTVVPEKLSSIILFSGVANSYPLQEHLHHLCNELHVIDFYDHHVYRKKDIDLIIKKYDEVFTRKKIIVTTEKDAMRLKNSPYISAFQNLPVYYKPVRVKFHKPDGEEFNKQIIDYVRKNKRNN